jgi:hypothetical protein
VRDLIAISLGAEPIRKTEVRDDKLVGLAVRLGLLDSVRQVRGMGVWLRGLGEEQILGLEVPE